MNCNPPFPGKERHYLRALIARISHACTIVPAGLYGEGEDENDPEPVIQEEFAMPAFAEQNPETWVHHYPLILQAGRTAHIAPPGLSEEDSEAKIGELNESDPPCDRLRGLNEDAPFGQPTEEEEEPAGPWRFSQVGDDQKYTAGDDPDVSYNALVI